MKTQILLTISMLCLTCICFAQTTNTFPPTGNVGIGTTNPTDKFQIEGNQFSIRNSITNNGIIFNVNAFGHPAILPTNGIGTMDKSLLLAPYGGNVGIGTDTPDQKLTIKGGGIGFDNISVDKKLYSPLDGVLEWFTHASAANPGFAVSHQGERRVYLSINGNSYLNGGNVGIGTANPQDKLTVAGNIGAREIKVSTNAGADFVFEPAYKLPDLAELEEFVKSNKHLPEIPTAKQMVENGVSLGELNIKLLQKVEELTLYLFQQQKQINELKKKLNQ